jgi:hypothetical protein
MPITCIETLPNEIFYEIFKYFDGFELYKSFSYLNIRFQNLLHHSSLVLKFTDDNISASKFKHRCRHFIIPNKQRICSLHFNHQSFIDIFFTSCNIDSSFTRLESLVLNKIKSQQLAELLPKLILLPCLFSLSVQLDDDNVPINDIYQLIFRLPFLKYNHLSIKKLNERSILLSNEKNEQFSSIEYFNIEHYITLNGLMSLLSYTPRLRRLTCKQLFSLHENNGKEMLITLSNLTHISIRMCHLSFNQFERFIIKISSQLQVLRIITSKSFTYLNADVWEQLIVQHIPQLSRFHFEYLESLNSYSLRPQINRFISPFWIKRRWMFELQIDNAKIIYSIHPHKSMWFNFDEQKEIERYYNQDADHNSTQPTVTVHFSDEWNQSSIDRITRILSLIPITYLNIDCSQINLLTFIKLLHNLPNLDALRLSFALSLLSTYLYAERSGIIHGISNKNNITKVNINKMIDIGEIRFIIDLCPRIRYLEIDCNNWTDTVLLLRFILTKQNNNYIPHLNILCLHVQNLNDDMMENLQRMIIFEKLLIDYIIKRVDDTINLYWKPQFYQ